MPTERCQRGKNALLELGLNFLLGPDPEVWKKVQSTLSAWTLSLPDMDSRANFRGIEKFKILSQIRYDGDNYKDRIPGHTGKAGDPGKLTKEILKYDDYVCTFHVLLPTTSWLSFCVSRFWAQSAATDITPDRLLRRRFHPYLFA